MMRNKRVSVQEGPASYSQLITEVSQDEWNIAGVGDQHVSEQIYCPDSQQSVTSRVYRDIWAYRSFSLQENFRPHPESLLNLFNLIISESGLVM